MQREPGYVNLKSMSSSRVFQITLFISLVIHGVILFQNPEFRSLCSPEKQKSEDKDLEVQYLKPLKEIKVPKAQPGRSQEPFLKLPPKVNTRRVVLPPLIDKEDIFKANRQAEPQKDLFEKPAFMKPDIIAVKTKITLSPAELDKNNSPTYVAHSQIVREKIKRALYQNYNRMEVGQVYLSFVLGKDGGLKDVRLVESQSSPSAYLREIALRSIKNAAPFPVFPKELDYDQLSFNVIISFEIE